MLNRWNAAIEKRMAFVTPACLVFGVLFPEIAGKGLPLVPVMFAVMTFIGALKSGFRDVGRVFQNPLPLLLAVLFLHVIMPAAAWGAGHLFFSDHPDLITGIVLEFTVPAAVVGVMWVSIYQGNQSMALSLVVLDTVLAPFVIPATLHVLVGTKVGNGSGRNDAGTGIYDRASGGRGDVPESAERRKDQGKLAAQACVFLQAVPDLRGDGKFLQSSALYPPFDRGAGWRRP